MQKSYPVIDMEKTGRNIKFIMKSRGLTVKDIQESIGIRLCAYYKRYKSIAA